MIRIQNLLLAAVGLCMMKVYWRAVDGIVNFMYSVCESTSLFNLYDFM